MSNTRRATPPAGSRATPRRPATSPPPPAEAPAQAPPPVVGDGIPVDWEAVSHGLANQLAQAAHNNAVLAQKLVWMSHQLLAEINKNKVTPEGE